VSAGIVADTSSSAPRSHCTTISLTAPEPRQRGHAGVERRDGAVRHRLVEIASDQRREAVGDLSMAL